MKNRKAFTLVELLVVIAIIAILAVAGVVGYTVFIDKAHKSNAVRDLTDIRTLIIAEDTSNEYFEITTEGIVFASGVVGETDALKFKTVITGASDTELAALVSKLSYDATNKTIVYESDDASATWHLEDNTID